jgi:uncharacterized protein
MITQEAIEAVCNQIAKQFDPDRIILFGSYAHGTPNQDSDVDLLILMPFEGKPHHMASRIRRLVKIPFPVDLLVKTSESAQTAYEQYCPFMRSAFNHGKVLYERRRQKMAS